MADDPAAVLRRLLDGVRTGGVVAFQEMDMGAVTWEPDCPLLAAAADRIVEAFVRAGIDHRTGLKLARIYRDAGLPAPGPCRAPGWRAAPTRHPGGAAAGGGRRRRRRRRPPAPDRRLDPEAGPMTATVFLALLAVALTA